MFNGLITNSSKYLFKSSLKCNKQFIANYTVISEMAVGQQTTINKAYQDLCELDYDSVEAFKVLISKLQDKKTKELMEEYKQDHERHIELTDILNNRGEKPPTNPDFKEYIVAKRPDIWHETKDMLTRGVEDEHRHRKGLEDSIKSLEVS